MLSFLHFLHSCLQIYHLPQRRIYLSHGYYGFPLACDPNIPWLQSPRSLLQHVMGVSGHPGPANRCKPLPQTDTAVGWFLGPLTEGLTLLTMGVCGREYVKMISDPLLDICCPLTWGNRWRPRKEDGEPEDWVLGAILGLWTTINPLRAYCWGLI